MTRSGERNALEPDPVPVLQRVRDLCGRFPEGPLPAAEVAAFRKSIESPRPLMRDHAAAGACYVEIRCGGEVVTREGFMSMFREAERFAEAGLGITAHAVEVSTANIAAAVRVPGLTRIGHGIHAAADPELLGLLVEHDVTLECALTCNGFTRNAIRAAFTSDGRRTAMLAELETSP